MIDGARLATKIMNESNRSRCSLKTQRRSFLVYAKNRVKVIYIIKKIPKILPIARIDKELTVHLFQVTFIDHAPLSSVMNKVDNVIDRGEM